MVEITKEMLMTKSIIKLVGLEKADSLETVGAILDYIENRNGDLSFAISYFCEIDNHYGFYISENLLLDYDIDIRTFEVQAKKNTEKMYPLVVNIFDAFECDEVMRVITSESGLNGAYALFDNAFLQTVANRLDDDLFIIPSSVHELIIIPAWSENVYRLMEMVKEVNDTVLGKDEILSYDVFYFDRVKNRITTF